MANARLSDQLGRVVSGRYRLVAPLGSGSSAQVYLADDVRLQRQVAVKMLQPALADDERFLRRFRTEAQTVASVSHPNVVVVHDWGDDDVPYLVTEYLAGGSLRAMLDAGHTLSASQALVVGLEVCRGLAHAHGRGLVHRDLKPANILFDADGRLRIADFGLARAIAEASITEHEGAVVGTARYAAPEQARGERMDGKADVYALALVLVEAVTGWVPFATDSTLGTLMARIERDIEVPESLGPLRPAIERAGRRELSERADAEEFGIALLAASERMTAPEPLPLAGALNEISLLEPDEQSRTDVVPLPLEVGDAAPGVAVPTVPTPRVPAAVDTSADAGPADTAPAAGGGQFGDVPPGEPRRRRRWPVVLAVLLAVALGAGAFVAYDATRTPTHEVPELVGQQLDDLELVAQQSGWEIDPKKTRLDGTEPGEIVSTDPPAGERLAEGGVLTVLVSEGNELTARPTDIDGRPLEEVVAELERAGLEHSVEEVFHEEVPAGSVISVAGEVDIRLPKGETVPLLVSQGPEPRTVPEIDPSAGYDAAAAALREIGLEPLRAEKFSDTVAAGSVISLSPPPGETVERGGTVTVTVSKGPDVVPVPDVSGKTIDEAEAVLVGAGLTLGQACCHPRGRVVAQEPSPGQSVRRGSSVDLLLSR